MTQTPLASRIAEVALLHGDFTLRSGRKSSYYLDKYLFSTQPDILSKLGPMFAQHIPPSATLLAGSELGGIPLGHCCLTRIGITQPLYTQPEKNIWHCETDGGACL